MTQRDSARHTEAAFETHLLENGYVRIAAEGFDRERAIFSETVLAFIFKAAHELNRSWKPATPRTDWG